MQQRHCGKKKKQVNWVMFYKLSWPIFRSIEYLIEQLFQTVEFWNIYYATGMGLFLHLWLLLGTIWFCFVILVLKFTVLPKSKKDDFEWGSGPAVPILIQSGCHTHNCCLGPVWQHQDIAEQWWTMAAWGQTKNIGHPASQMKDA